MEGEDKIEDEEEEDVGDAMGTRMKTDEKCSRGGIR